MFILSHSKKFKFDASIVASALALSVAKTNSSIDSKLVLTTATIGVFMFSNSMAKIFSSKIGLLSIVISELVKSSPILSVAKPSSMVISSINGAGSSMFSVIFTSISGAEIFVLFGKTDLVIVSICCSSANKLVSSKSGRNVSAKCTSISISFSTVSSIFTGKFDSDKIDPSNPQAAIHFGIPFVGRPSKLKLKYKFSPGAVNKNKQGDVLAYPDMLDIYALLEIRFSGKIQRLGTAWLRSSDNTSELNTVEIPFNYGELDSSFPDYMKPVDGVYVSQDSAQFVLPTHITFVASSSFDGANFAGAIGSELIVDDVEMVYDEE